MYSIYDFQYTVFCNPVTMWLILVAAYRPGPNSLLKYSNWTMWPVLKTFDTQRKQMSDNLCSLMVFPIDRWFLKNGKNFLQGPIWLRSGSMYSLCDLICAETFKFIIFSVFTKQDSWFHMVQLWELDTVSLFL